MSTTIPISTSADWTTPFAVAPAVRRVALAGCGAVGGALVRELTARRATLVSRYGVDTELATVLVRDVTRPRSCTLERGLLTGDLDGFLATEADVVIEAIGGIDPARRIVSESLRRGRVVITANKELLAAHGTALAALAERHGGVLRYDAAVGGGVPVLRMLDDALGAGTPHAVRGILNGTSNFVLDRLHAGASLDEALEEARRAGFAEADASRDLDGRDAAAKVALVAWAAFGVAPESVQVRRTSLLPAPDRWVRLAQRVGGVVRQVAECARVGDVVVASVEPVIVAPFSALAATVREQNRVEVHTGWSAPLCASGPGAGGVPTATALLADLLCTGRAASRSVTRFATGEDERRADWALEIAGAPLLLHAEVPACALVHTDVDARISWTTIRGATAREIEQVLVRLRARGADPIAARVDVAEVAERAVA